MRSCRRLSSCGMSPQQHCVNRSLRFDVRSLSHLPCVADGYGSLTVPIYVPGWSHALVFAWRGDNRECAVPSAGRPAAAASHRHPSACFLQSDNPPSLVLLYYPLYLYAFVSL